MPFAYYERLIAEISAKLGVPPLRTQVLAVRPSRRWGELHGLYLCHHLDYEMLGLADSYHTDGFYRRESSLLRQLLPPAPEGEGYADG